MVIAPATIYQTAAPEPTPIAVVAQGRAPATGDMGARPIYDNYSYGALVIYAHFVHIPLNLSNLQIHLESTMNLDWGRFIGFETLSEN